MNPLKIEAKWHHWFWLVPIMFFVLIFYMCLHAVETVFALFKK